MGQALLRLAADRDDVEVVAAVARTVGQRVIDGIPRYAASELGGVPAFDVAIDFSLPDGFDSVLALCVDRAAALVSGTTGLDRRPEGRDGRSRTPYSRGLGLQLQPRRRAAG